MGTIDVYSSSLLWFLILFSFGCSEGDDSDVVERAAWVAAACVDAVVTAT